MTHLKRLNAPNTWPIERKATAFVAKPLPGTHKLEECMPVGLLLREILKLGKDKREIKIILNNKNISIDNKIRKDVNFPVGLFDTLSIPPLNKYYKILYNTKGKLILSEIPKEESEHKICKIIGKTILKKKKVQINLSDSRNILVDKDNYKVRDSIIVKNNKIIKHLKFEKNALIYLIGGKHIGAKGNLVEVKKFPGVSKDIIVFKSDNKNYETLAEYAYVIEKWT